MVKLINLFLENHILSMMVLIEGDEARAFKLFVDMKTECLAVIKSEIPDEYKIYERQAKTALRRYRGKELPDTITSMWC